MTFLKQIFSESGNGSWSRVGSFIALMFSCAWVTYVVYYSKAIPSLDGVALFVGTLYGLGKASQVATTKFKNGTGNGQTNSTDSSPAAPTQPAS